MSGALGPVQTTTVSWWLRVAARGAPGPAGSGHRPIKTRELLLPGLPSLGSTLQCLQGSCPKQLPWLNWLTAEEMSPTVVTEWAKPGDESAPIRT
ncbi:hypothetical protein CesoFtcFv8_012222 [Champsocephalus esox]|uniref:Uncharacterized protein n=1 Tax=Champsocephalus esox TaxID=159716 RepID=A0AAN8BU19_9TELE|nr:hypothetical protein CesoFtcFv8_012222 [Champsocephalus esox]